jgi:PAS domain S-box-containing protein
MIKKPDFSALFAASPYPYLLVDTDFIIIGANPAYLRATARSAEELTGKHIFEAFPANPADPDSTNLHEVRTSIELAIATRQPHTTALLRYAVPHATPTGTVFDERYWSAIHTPVFDDSGAVAFVAQNAIDVTDLYRFDAATRKYYVKQDANAVPDVQQMNRPQMHEAMTRILSAERSQLQILFDQAPGFIAVLTGHAHTFEMANDAYYQLVGYRDILGKPVCEALPEVAGQGFVELMDNVFSTGQAVVLRERAIALQRTPGAPLEERYLDLLYQPIVGTDGRVTGIFAQGNDVTAAVEANRALSEQMRQAMQAETDLRAERDRSQYIFDSMAEGFAVLDAGWTILHMNAEGLRLSGRTATQVIGRNHWDVFPEIKGTGTEAIYRRVMETGKTEITEIAHTARDGTPTWMEIRTHRSLDGGIAFFFRDVTDRRAAQEQLMVADRRKDEFLAMLAHELRNPLAPIGAAAELLQRATLDDARVRQTSQVIGRQVEHMTHLINDLLDMSRVTRGLVTLDTAALDIRDIVAEAVEQVAPLIAARCQRLALHLPPQAIIVQGDRKRLVQVLANILNNAAKYTDEGGNIVLRTEVDEARVLVEIVDDGIGMAPELVAHAFDLFAQAERTSDRSAGGLGLGLALVKSLVELHRGTVACRSEGHGKGSAFTVCLPRLALAAQVDAAPSAHEPPAAHAGALRIMIVDDNADAAAMLAMLLETCGHQVTVEHDAPAALAHAATAAAQVFLLDIGLPGMDGTELARRLRRLPGGAEAVLIAVTGYGQDSDRARTRAAGFDHHLVKPVDAQRLLGILERL